MAICLIDCGSKMGSVQDCSARADHHGRAFKPNTANAVTDCPTQRVGLPARVSNTSGKISTHHCQIAARSPTTLARTRAVRKPDFHLVAAMDNMGIGTIFPDGHTQSQILGRLEPAVELTKHGDIHYRGINPRPANKPGLRRC
jgi:hypothetical protein